MTYQITARVPPDKQTPPRQQHANLCQFDDVRVSRSSPGQNTWDNRRFGLAFITVLADAQYNTDWTDLKVGIGGVAIATSE